MGGDEVNHHIWEKSARYRQRASELGHQTTHESFNYFVRRLATFYRSHGKEVLAWDDAVTTGATDIDIMTYWKDWTYVDKTAANHNIRLIYAPTGCCYFDFFDTFNPWAARWEPPEDMEPPAFPAYTSLRRTYEFIVPQPSLPADKHHLVLGVQAQLWSEKMFTYDIFEYRAFPRLGALAEKAWTAREHWSWDSFNLRLPAYLERLDQQRVTFRRPRPWDNDLYVSRLAGNTKGQVVKANTGQSYLVT